MRILTPLVAALLVTSATAGAQTANLRTSEIAAGPLVSGNDYLRYCQAEEGTVDYLVCAYFTRGVIGGWGVRDRMNVTGIAGSGNRLTCLPETASTGQVMSITVAWLEDNPEDRHLLASEAIALSLLRVFRCPT